MDWVTPELAATILAGLTALVVQLSVRRMDHHESEAHELAAKVAGLEKDLATVEHERNDWREKYYACREREADHAK